MLQVTLYSVVVERQARTIAGTAVWSCHGPAGRSSGTTIRRGPMQLFAQLLAAATPTRRERREHFRHCPIWSILFAPSPFELRLPSDPLASQLRTLFSSAPRKQLPRSAHNTTKLPSHQHTRAPWRPLAASDSRTKMARTSLCSVLSTTARLADQLPASSVRPAQAQARLRLEVRPPPAHLIPLVRPRQAHQAAYLAEVTLLGAAASVSPAQAEPHPRHSAEEVRPLAAT
jgi:hypothetical protein